ncbi:MAG: alginate lyase family protein [Bacteroidia bacterium]|nr:alginate lyase family protein [Bacteroidia bacterium]
MPIRSFLSLIFVGALFSACSPVSPTLSTEILSSERTRVMTAADSLLAFPVITLTASQSDRSAGGIHDFYSEGDYWWPDTGNPGGPYIRKDGLTNPDNFTEHREYMRRLSIMVPALVSAFLLTGETRYADRATDHLMAWFVEKDTKMNPNLLYSQAIYGISTGRGIGIIDAIHLVEVVQACQMLEARGRLQGEELTAIKQWFADFTTWMTTHPYGLEEKNNGNNHSTCWAMQVAMYAQFTGNDSLFNATREFYQTVLLPDQLAPDGSFPKEMARTKPYGYSLFNLDAMFTLAHILATDDPELWQFGKTDSLYLKAAIDFMFPYIADKGTWPLAPDVLYFDEWPMRHTALLFAYQAYGEDQYLDLWKTLPSDSQTEEVQRNFFVRQPVLWVYEKPH